jgi:hypothetical protein
MPQRMIKSRLLLISFAAVAALACGVAVAAEAPRDYATDLARVYDGYQRFLALKEACDTAVPATRAANGKAFAAWQAQHRVLIQDLQRRIRAMVLAASTDKEDYVRNVGKYEGEILLQHKEYRDILLGLGAEELRNQCQRMPEMLKGPSADLARVYAAELATLRKRK